MRLVKILFGLLAGVFALAHLYRIIMFFTASGDSAYAGSRLMGSVAGFLVGIVISLVLFRSARGELGGNSGHNTDLDADVAGE